MLRMSKLADYATVIMITMARDPEAVKSAGSLAETTGIPAPTVSKVMKTLARGGVLVSVRGMSGGYQLPLPPQRITLSDVIAAVDGPFGMTECTALPGLCTQEAVCSARANWRKVNRLIFDALRLVSLADMAGPTLSEGDISAIHARRLLPLAHPGTGQTRVISVSPRKPATTRPQR
ncbi:SUF system Fe-S cluster assembly regulator [Paraburkholderia terrae]|uniref:SUF system Fe-S cluster assembly regulator n=1 Tax=Paraburkholderia terrae TaxID=311230 RepID=UPI00296AFE5D|nr:SUF system Fe-S cluster assembly regulator [Paraburkholderia terrae]MDW3659751.1 SUF system Fe-S cluster assembly regulator [Paraburkholderia terrae]